jgi:hypothetical protein
MPAQALRRVAPLLVPFVIAGVAWVVFIGPTSAAAARDAVRRDALNGRLASAPGPAGDFPPPIAVGDPVAAFERQVSSGDVTAQLLGHLTRLALDVDGRNLFIDSTDAPVAVATGSGPQVAGAVQPDPRIALFRTPLEYSSIPMTFDSSYTGLGDFLWRLRDLPVLVELREMTVIPRVLADVEGRAPSPGARLPHDGTVRVSLIVFVYARQGAPVASPAGAGGGR